MTLQNLTYLVALAEEKSFTKAAKRCFVTQPAFSRAIAELEKELGRLLLVRNSRGIELTHAGVVCYEEARKILRQCSVLTERVRSDSDTTAGTVRLGYLFNNSLNLVAGQIRRLGQMYPNVRLETSYEDFNDAKRMLETEELDLVLLGEANVPALDNVEEYVLIEGGLYIVVHVTHRLFARRSVSFEDLRGERFMFFDPQELPGLHNRMLEAFRAAGLEPEITAYGRKLGDMVAYATLNNGVGLTTQVASNLGDGMVHILPVTDCTNGFGVSLVRRRDNPNPMAEAFFNQIRLMDS